MKRDAEGVCPGTASPEPTIGTILAVFGIALTGVVLTRWPVARVGAFDLDEVGYMQTVAASRLPMHHTLFLASARVLGNAVGDAYRGFVVLDILVSALALTSVWWWLRALVRPATAATATLVLGVAPVFWAYGAMAANYTAIPLVGSFLLGIAYRGWSEPRPWHPLAAAVVLALGTGYRQDIGTFWLPVFLVIVWRHRWIAAARALALFTALNLAWLLPMLHEAGGWEPYHKASAEFAHSAGYLNSVWNLGVVDAPVRYAVKASMALVWTLGPGLAFAPRGVLRLVQTDRGRFLVMVMALGVAPALASHLLVHFGVAGYCFHYIPSALALVALGIGRTSAAEEADSSPIRLAGLAALLASVFLFYPTDYERRDFDLAFARQTRIGLRTPSPLHGPSTWRTANSRDRLDGRRW